MLANAIIIGFVLAMAYWWSLQGFFSSFMHLLFVIVAGTLAFAVWEPLAHLALSFDTAMLSHYALGLALLLPFAILLGILRFLGDTLVPNDLYFPNLINGIGGGVLGFISAVLTAGITILSLSFIPLDYSIAGFQPYLVTTNGRVEPRGGWLARVDAVAADVFSQLSAGAFYPLSGQSLARNYPELARQAAEYRLAREVAPNKAITASPEGVRLGEVAWVPTPVESLDPVLREAIGRGIDREGGSVLTVETLWSQAQPQTGDQTLRIYPVECRLLARDANGRRHYIEPVAFSRAYRVPLADGEVGLVRDLKLVDSNEVAQYGDVDPTMVSWVFVLDEGLQPYGLTTRGIRHTLNVPAAPSEDEAQAELAVNLMGRLRTSSEETSPGEAVDGAAVAENGEGATGAEFEARQGRAANQAAEAIEITDSIPYPISRNQVSRIQSQDGDSFIRGGSAENVERPRNLSQRLKLDAIYTPSQFRCVRVQVSRDDARSLLGQAQRRAMDIQPIYLRDRVNQQYEPIAWVWQSDRGLTMEVDIAQPIRSTSQLPIRQMREGDELFLYFHVRPGVTITSYNIGPTEYPVDLQVPAD